MSTPSRAQDRRGLSRRTLVHAAAWSGPAIAITSTAPAYATSTRALLAFSQPVYTVTAGQVTAPSVTLFNAAPHKLLVGETVVFELSAGLSWADASTGSKSVVTDENGVARAPGVRAPDGEGEHTITARSASALEAATASIVVVTAGIPYFTGVQPAFPFVVPVASLIDPSTKQKELAKFVFIGTVNSSWVISESGNVFAAEYRSGAVTHKLRIPSAPIDAWQRSLGDGLQAGVLGADGKAYFVDATKGTLVTAVGIGSSPVKAVIYANTNGWVFTEDGDIYEVNIKTGAATLSMRIGTRIAKVFPHLVQEASASGVIAEDGTVYFVWQWDKSFVKVTGFTGKAVFVAIGVSSAETWVVNEAGGVFVGNFKTGVVKQVSTLPSPPKRIDQYPVGNTNYLGVVGEDGQGYYLLSNGTIRTITGVPNPIEWVFVGLYRYMVIDSVGDIYYTTYPATPTMPATKAASIGRPVLRAFHYPLVEAANAGVLLAAD